MTPVVITPLRARASWARKRTEHDPPESEIAPPVGPKPPRIYRVRFVVTFTSERSPVFHEYKTRELEAYLRRQYDDATLEVHRT